MKHYAKLLFNSALVLVLCVVASACTSSCHWSCRSCHARILLFVCLDPREAALIVCSSEPWPTTPYGCYLLARGVCTCSSVEISTAGNAKEHLVSREKVRVYKPSECAGSRVNCLVFTCSVTSLHLDVIAVLLATSDCNPSCC